MYNCRQCHCLPTLGHTQCFCLYSFYYTCCIFKKACLCYLKNKYINIDCCPSSPKKKTVIHKNFLTVKLKLVTILLSRNYQKRIQTNIQQRNIFTVRVLIVAQKLLIMLKQNIEIQYFEIFALHLQYFKSF